MDIKIMKYVKFPNNTLIAADAIQSVRYKNGEPSHILPYYYTGKLWWKKYKTVPAIPPSIYVTFKNVDTRSFIEIPLSMGITDTDVASIFQQFYFDLNQ